jgi:Dipeptidyl peptidase IV (DPP IV) N-terminal region
MHATLQVRLAVVDVYDSQIHNSTQEQPRSQQADLSSFKPIWMDTLSSYAKTDEKSTATATATDKAASGDSNDSDDSYLARVMWIHIQQQSTANSGSTSTITTIDSSTSTNGSSSGMSRLLAQVQNREQTSLQLLLLDPLNGTKVVLLEETSDIWINLHHLLRCLPKVVPVVSCYTIVIFYYYDMLQSCSKHGCLYAHQCVVLIYLIVQCCSLHNM